MPHAFLQFDNHSSKETTYQPQAQISNHGRACAQGLLLYKMPHAFLQLDNHSSKQTTYQPQAQISNHGRACTQALFLYKMPHAFLWLDNHSSKYATNLVRGSYERANSTPNNFAGTYFVFQNALCLLFL
jgi:hypothetical protein